MSGRNVLPFSISGFIFLANWAHGITSCISVVLCKKLFTRVNFGCSSPRIVDMAQFLRRTIFVLSSSGAGARTGGCVVGLGFTISSAAGVPAIVLEVREGAGAKTLAPDPDPDGEGCKNEREYGRGAGFGVKLIKEEEIL